MPNRDLVTRLIADPTGFDRGFKSAERSAQTFTRSMNKELDRQRKTWSQSNAAQNKYFAELESKQRRHEQITEGMGQGFIIAGAAIGVGVGVAVKSFMDFDKAMSGVKAVSNATAGEMDRLREAALKAGADTAFSATEAAQAQAELAKVGISTADILGGALRGSLDLAAAGGLDLAEAATIAGQSMKIFNLQGKDVGHIADLLAAGANKSAADVSQLGDSLRQGGLVAAQAGLSIEDTVGALAMFSDNALIGSDAGTSLKTMLMMLMNPTEKSSVMMEQLGINAYDTAGNFVGLEAFAGQLQARLSGLTAEQRDQALAQIFGSDAMRAANVLYKEGAGGVREYSKAVNDQGAAGRMASIQMDNLSGDLEELRGSLETALIRSGSAGNDVLRSMAQAATGTVNAFNGLPEPLQKSVGLLGAGGAAALTAAGGFLFLAPRIRNTQQALADMNITTERMKGWAGKVAIGAGVLAGYSAFIAVIDQVQNATMDAAPGIERLTSSMIDYARSGALVGPMTKLFGRDLNELGGSIRRLTDKSNAQGFSDMTLSITSFGMLSAKSMKQAKQDITSVDQALASLVQQGRADLAAKAFDQMATAAGRGGASVGEFKSVLPGYAEALAAAGNQSKLAGDKQKGMGAAVDGTTGEVRDQESAIKDLVDQIDILSGGALAGRAAERQFQAALDAATVSARTNGKALSNNTEKGRANQAALDEIASSANGVSKALIENGAAQNTVARRASAARAEFVRHAVAMGMDERKARDLARAVIAIPRAKPTTITQPGMVPAIRNAQTLRQRLQDIPRSRTVTITAQIRATGMGGVVWGSPSVLAAAHGRATGGWIPGSSPHSRSDNIPAMLTAGEYVIQQPAAKALARSDPGLLDRLNHAHLLGGDPDTIVTPRFATGGYVKRGQVAAGWWDRMVTAGWRGSKRDSMDAIYPPQKIKAGTVPWKVWGQFTRLGWKPKQDGSLVSLYPPPRGWKPKPSAHQLHMMHLAHLAHMAHRGRRGFAAGGSVPGVQSWARAQRGEPYVWGGTGPTGWDCSGYAGGAYGLFRGKSPNQRYFTTATVAGAPGIKSGRGAFTMGVNTGPRGVGHMAFQIGGEKYEATPPRVRVGSSARSVSAFNRQYHLSGVADLTAKDIFKLLRMAGPQIARMVARDVGFRTADSGATLAPGLNAPLYNGTGRPEHLVPVDMRYAHRARGGMGGGKSVSINAPITINGVSDTRGVRMEVEAAMRNVARQADLMARAG